jgi:DNA-binding NarL/FixJ family response regulator
MRRVSAKPTEWPAGFAPSLVPRTVQGNGDGARIALATSSRERLNSQHLRTLLLRCGGQDQHAASLDNAEDLEKLLASFAPRMLFVGVELCALIGAAGLHHLRHLSPSTDWVLVWPQPSPRWYETVLHTQARGGVAWDIEIAQCQRAMNAMLAGELWLPRAMMQALYTSLLGSTLATPHGNGVLGPGGVLTHREAEAMLLMRRGLQNKEIAARLGISVNTVKKHLAHAFEKRGLHSRRQMLG